MKKNRNGGREKKRKPGTTTLGKALSLPPCDKMVREPGVKK